MKIIKKGISEDNFSCKDYTVNFESFNDFFEKILFIDSSYTKNQKSRMFAYQDDESWLGENIPDLIEKVKSGFGIYTDKIEKLAKEIEAEVLSLHSLEWSSYLGESGAEVDIGRYLENDPECMRQYNTEEKSVLGKIVNINVAICHPCNVCNSITCFVNDQAESIINRGIALGVLIRVLENMGIKSKINVYSRIYVNRDISKINNNLQFFTININVKDFNFLTDEDLLYFTLTHPSMFRRFVLLWVEDHLGFAEGTNVNFSKEEIEGYDLHYTSISHSEDSKKFRNESYIREYVLKSFEVLKEKVINK